jgi:trigger factor
MNIKKESTSDLTELITFEFYPEDYQSQVEKSLKDLRQTIEIPGFRKKMVPIEIINKRYGKNVRYEQITKLVNEKLTNCIQEYGENLIFNPVLCTDKIVADYEQDGNFSFPFEIVVRPEIKIPYDDLKSVPYYAIVPTEEGIDERITSIRMKTSVFSSAETVAEGDNLIVGVSFQKEDTSMFITSTLPLNYIKEEERPPFIGKKLHEEMDMDTTKIFNGDYERAAFFNIKLEELETAPVDAHIKINAIHHFEPATIDAKFFEQYFPDGNVSSETELREFVRQILIKENAYESKRIYLMEVIEALTDRIAPTLTFPDEFLKKYLVEVLKINTTENIEKNYDNIKKEMVNQFVKTQLAQDLGVSINQEEILQCLYNYFRSQYFGATEDLNESQEEVLRQMVIKAVQNKKNIKTATETITFEKMMYRMEDKIKPPIEEITADALLAKIRHEMRQDDNQEIKEE